MKASIEIGSGTEQLVVNASKKGKTCIDKYVFPWTERQTCPVECEEADARMESSVCGTDIRKTEEESFEYL
jgi:hypothetical protein